MKNQGEIIIGLDIGTTGCKAIAVDSRGRVIASAGGTYPLHSHHGNSVEQDVTEIWPVVAKSLRTLSGQLRKLGQSPHVTVLALSGAMHSLMAVERSGRPITHATIWADASAVDEAKTLRQRADAADLYLQTGCPFQATYHPARLRHLLKTTPRLRRNQSLFVAIKDWVIHRLNGTWATDLSLASATGLLDIQKCCWHPAMLKIAGIDATRLPPLVKPEDIAGTLTAKAAKETGLPTGLPILAGAGDGALANLGAGAVHPGQVVITVGTSGAVRKIVTSPQLDTAGEGGRTWCYLLTQGRYYCGGAINNGGLALAWVRDRFYHDLEPAAASRIMLTQAAKIPLGCDGLMILPYFTGERSPHWNGDLRAAVHGLSLNHTRAHFARAVMEGVAMCLADVWDIVGQVGEAGCHGLTEAPGARQAMPKKQKSIYVKLTGGVVHDPLWPGIIADVLGVDLELVDAADASALGATMLARWAPGNTLSTPAKQTSLEDMASRVARGPIVRTHAGRHATYRALHQRFRSLTA